MTISFGLLALPGLAQNIESFEYFNDPIDGEAFIGIGINRSLITNSAAPYPENHRLAGGTLYLDLKQSKYGAGQLSIYYTNQLIGDLIFSLARSLNGKSALFRHESTTLTSGYTGWLDFHLNLTKPGLVQPFLGGHHHDYLIGSTYVVDSSNTPSHWVSNEPQGYYFAAGPTVGARMALGDILMLEAKANYSVGYVRIVSVDYANRDDDYAKPHFVQLQLDLQTKWGVFGMLQHHRIINRGDLPNNTHRWDATLGFRIML